MSVRFLHAADLHLGLRLTRFEGDAARRISLARIEALDKLKKAAIEHRVQFVIIAGDIYDDNAVAASMVNRVFEILNGSTWPGSVFIIPGNHDPLTPGSVWERDPWKREQPHKSVRLLRSSEPVHLPELSTTLFPCPLRHRTSVDDPTAWIAGHPRTGDGTIRIGIAHGSLNIMPNLPEDDHLIPKDAAERLGLDYLALGHWHSPLVHGSRTAYPGTHEPMRFPNVTTSNSTGWIDYSPNGSSDLFADNGHGTAYIVEIDGPGAIPRLEKIEVSRLRWLYEEIDATSHKPGQMMKDYTERPDRERTLMRLRLTGVLTPRDHRRLDELKEVIEDQYHLGSTFDADAVLIEPTEDELRAAVGNGVLPKVLERLKADLEALDADRRTVAAHALKILYRLAWEDRPA